MHTIGAAHPGWRKQQRNVQSQIAPGLPPQLNPGEYKQLVRKSLDMFEEHQWFGLILNMQALKVLGLSCSCRMMTIAGVPNLKLYNRFNRYLLHALYRLAWN